MRIILAIGATVVPALAAAFTGAGSDSDAGERAYQKCYSCHSLKPGEIVDGPDLAAAAGDRVARRADFDYSPPLRRFAKANPVWTDELLDQYLADPEGLVPGTAMAFRGISDPAERAAIIAYLKRTAPSGPRRKRTFRSPK